MGTILYYLQTVNVNCCTTMSAGKIGIPHPNNATINMFCDAQHHKQAVYNICQYMLTLSAWKKHVTAIHSVICIFMQIVSEERSLLLDDGVCLHSYYLES